ncbi:MAG: hypothetical protein R2941_22560 [Desulfobacterales bacterium]
MYPGAWTGFTIAVADNDGDLHLRLSHPSFDHEKEYEVIVGQTIRDDALHQMEKGLLLDGTMTRQGKNPAAFSKPRITAGLAEPADPAHGGMWAVMLSASNASACPAFIWEICPKVSGVISRKKRKKRCWAF